MERKKIYGGGAIKVLAEEDYGAGAIKVLAEEVHKEGNIFCIINGTCVLSIGLQKDGMGNTRLAKDVV